MTTLEVKGDWNITKGKLKQKWAKLTDSDLQYVEGKQEELVGRIQKLTGEIREAVENVIKDSSNTSGCGWKYVDNPRRQSRQHAKNMNDHVYKLIDLTGT